MRTIRLSLKEAGIAFAYLAMLVAPACKRSSDAETGRLRPNKIVVVFIDRSQSTAAERQLYAKALDAILKSLKDGDRFVLGAITEESSKDFVKYIDRALPPPPPAQTIWDNELDYKKDAAKQRQEVQKVEIGLRKEVDVILAEPSKAKRSAIFETLIIADQIFASEKRKKVLVLLSDMLEDSREANFEHVIIDEAFIDHQIQRQKQSGVLPNLREVAVYVVGAHARTPERAAAVQHFWEHYFEATGASLGRGHYSRMLFVFQE